MHDPPQDTADRLFAAAARRFEQGWLEDSRAQLDALLELFPERPDALLLLAQVHRRLGYDYAEMVCLIRLASVMPLTSDLTIRLSTLQMDSHLQSYAIETMRRAVEADPQDTELRSHYAYLLRVTRHRQEALEELNRILAVKPDDACARFEQALIYLSDGRLAQGWQDFDQRHGVDPDYVEPAGLVRWQGESFAGRRLVVTTEGGFGDNVWAARFLKPVRQLGGTLILQVHPALRELFAQVEGIDEFIDVDACLDGFDFYCPILSLPVCLDVDEPERYPPAQLAWRASADERFQELLARAGNRFRVGIIWSGSETYANNHQRGAARVLLAVVDSPKDPIL
ncbi:MAG: hypothetical protein R3C53_16055 [Pirellulaceae bacterium]